MGNYSMEEIIRTNIKNYNVNRWETDDENDCIYTNLDGSLKDVKGELIPEELEVRVCQWHKDILQDTTTIPYVLFYRKKSVTYQDGGTGFCHFSTCLTEKTISFRVAIDKNEREVKRGTFYYFTWEELIGVEETEVCKGDPYNMQDDPVFLLYKNSDGTLFYTKDRRLNVPTIYFSRFNAKGFLNSIINKENFSVEWGSKSTAIPKQEYVEETNKIRETIIKECIEKHNLDKYIVLENSNLYTNLDGELKDNQGNTMPLQEVNRLYDWHYLAPYVPSYVVFSYCFQSENKEIIINFSTCITAEAISFRAIFEVNGEQDTVFSPFYRLSWDAIKEIKVLEEVQKDNINLLLDDPTFIIWREAEVPANIFFLKAGEEVIITPLYFALLTYQIYDFLNDIVSQFSNQ